MRSQCNSSYLAVAEIRNGHAVPKLTEEQAIKIMKADLQERVGNISRIRLYGEGFQDPSVRSQALPLIYYRQGDNVAFRINGTSHGIIGHPCVPSMLCFLANREDVLDSIDRRLVYFLDGAYVAGKYDSPLFYYVDAMNGNITCLSILTVRESAFQF